MLKKKDRGKGRNLYSYSVFVVVNEKLKERNVNRNTTRFVKLKIYIESDTNLKTSLIYLYNLIAFNNFLRYVDE